MGRNSVNLVLPWQTRISQISCAREGSKWAGTRKFSPSMANENFADFLHAGKVRSGLWWLLISLGLKPHSQLLGEFVDTFPTY